MATSSRGYTRVQEIGKGSYGLCSLVQDREGKLYVMKTIDISRMDGKQRRDAINEVKVLSSLKHPYIVSYRESFTEGGALAIVMDYADGGDLYNRIQRTRRAGQTFQEVQVMRWFTEAALAMKYMHDKHVLHRDLKSQNLFLTSSDRLRIGDFGISKVLENTAAFARTTIGTPYYLSPEICQEKPYSFSSDVWALGCILYEMAALKVPFDAQNIQALVRKITGGPAPTVPNAYSHDMRQLCCDLLHRDLNMRPSTGDIVQRPLVQAEIRRMLREEQAKRPATGSVSGSGMPSSHGVPPSMPSSNNNPAALPPMPPGGVGQRAGMAPGGMGNPPRAPGPPGPVSARHGRDASPGSGRHGEQPYYPPSVNRNPSTGHSARDRSPQVGRAIMGQYG